MRVLVLAVGFLLAGCVTPPTLAEPNDDTEAAETSVAFAGMGCQIGGLGFMVDPAHAQEHLPDWAVAADAQQVLGTPAPTGRGFILVETYRCAAHTFANDSEIGLVEVSIAIQAPDVPGEREPTSFHWFQPTYGAPAGADAVLDVLRWDHFEVDVTTLDITPLPTGSALGTWESASPDGIATSARVAGPAPVPINGINRFWQVHEEGTTYLDYDIGLTAGMGVADCTLGGPVAEAVGITTCAPGEAVGFVVAGFDFTATGHFLAGIHPNATATEARAP